MGIALGLEPDPKPDAAEELGPDMVFDMSQELEIALNKESVCCCWHEYRDEKTLNFRFRIRKSHYIWYTWRCIFFHAWTVYDR